MLALGAGEPVQQLAELLHIAVVVARVVLPAMHEHDEAEVLRHTFGFQHREQRVHLLRDVFRALIVEFDNAEQVLGGRVGVDRVTLDGAGLASRRLADADGRAVRLVRHAADLDGRHGTDPRETHEP